MIIAFDRFRHRECTLQDSFDQWQNLVIVLGVEMALVCQDQGFFSRYSVK